MAVIIDKNSPANIIEKIESLGVKCYFSTSIENLYFPVNTHPDMQIHFVSDSVAIAAPCVFEYYKKTLPTHIKLIKGSTDVEGTYPFDVAYNVASLGKRIIGNLSYTDAVLKNFYEDLKYEFLDVKQGYTKCNLCIVDENSVITEDDGLSKTLISKGFDVLKIPAGEISLPGFPYGFIGGASGFIMPNVLGFCGNIDSLSYADSIKSFLKEKGIEFVSLSRDNLIDLGSIVYFKDFSY